MNEHILTVSPKGQITIPVALRNQFKSNKLMLKLKGNSMVLVPLQLVPQEEELKEFSKLSKKSFEFWDNPEDDIYQEYYDL